MNTRDDILQKLRAQTRPSEANYDELWTSKRNFADLADQFTRALTAVAGQVHRAPSWDKALEILDQQLTQRQAQQVVLNDVPPLNGVDLAATRPNITWHTAGTQSAADLRQICATADIGLSHCEAALAETGTVLVASGTGQARLVTLLPPVHIALVPTHKLTTDLFTWTASRDAAAPLPAHLVAISGPSKTADIEQTMAIGVHGPKEFVVILYEVG